MRWSERRDGAVTIYDDTDTNDDMLVVEPTITAFMPTGRCDCRGGAISIRCAIGGTFEVYCLLCHKAHARFDLGTKVHG
jgi:hypothetical protein